MGGPCDARFGFGSNTAINGTISRVCAGDDCSRGKVARAFTPRGADALMGEIKFNIVCDSDVVGCDTLSEVAWPRLARIVSREHANWGFDASRMCTICFSGCVCGSIGVCAHVRCFKYVSVDGSDADDLTYLW